MYLALVNCIGSLSLPKNSVVRLTDHPDMTVAVYHECKAPKQQSKIYVIENTGTVKL